MSCDFYQLPRMSFSLPLAVRLKRYGESFFFAWHRSADFRGASERWHFCQREPTTTPTPQTHGNGSRSTAAARRTSPAQGAIIAAETPAPRTAPHLGDEEGNLARAGIFARNQEWKCSPAPRDVLVVLFSLHRALGCARK